MFKLSTGHQHRFVFEGPEVSACEWEACLKAFELLDLDNVVASGTLHFSLASNAYEHAARKNARFIVDTSGAALRDTLDQGVFIIMPNLCELEELVGRSLEETHDQAAAGRDLIARKAAEITAVTLGEHGALIISKYEVWHAVSPPVKARSAVGARDSFVGAITLAIAQGHRLDAALANGVAAGTGRVLSYGAELSRAKDVERLHAEPRRNMTWIA